MATNFPTSADDSSSLPNPAAGNMTNSPSLSSGQTNQNDAIKAIEAKLGTGSSTPVVSRLLFGTGTGTSAWTQLTSAQLAASLSDETGTGTAVFGTTPTLVTPKVDTINESTPAAGVTIDGVLLKDAKVNGSYVTDGTVASAQLATGVPVQTVSTNNSTMSTGTTIIPFDDTIPQITEGTELVTQAVTPKSITNRLVIEVSVMMSSSSSNHLIVALFQDATSNALAAIAHYQVTANGDVCLKLTHDMVTGTTSSTTFRARIGQELAGTWTVNGQAGTRRFGGITISNIKITEYKA